jgi:hypothetical protein
LGRLTVDVSLLLIVGIPVTAAILLLAYQLTLIEDVSLRTLLFRAALILVLGIGGGFFLRSAAAYEPPPPEAGDECTSKGHVVFGADGQSLICN